MLKNLRIGVCLLDAPNTGNGTGAAVLDGKEDRITSLSDLKRSTEILWLTNLDYDTYKNHQHFRLGNVKPDQLLRSRVDNLAKELGFQDAFKPIAAHIMSRIAQSTIEYSAMMTGAPIIELDNASQRLDWILKTRVLPAARHPVASDAASISVAMDAHMFNYAVYPSRGDYIKRFYTVPRTSMARVLLQSLPYPSLWNPWQYIEFPKPVELTAHGKLPAELDGRAAFVKVEIRGMNPDRDTWAPFTKRREQGGSIIPRNWIALPEALSYAEDGVVEVTAAYVNDLERLKLPHQLPTQANDGLISAQLFAESFMYAIGGKTGYDKSRKPRASGHCALAAYMWAYERVYMAKLAKVFQAKGIGQITTVGSLQLQIQMVPSMIDMADTLALQNCLEPPMADYEKDGASIPPYSEIVHTPRTGGAKYEPQSFTVEDWIHNPKALVHLTSFSFMKAAGNLNKMLLFDAISSDPSRKQEAQQIQSEALEAMRKKMLGSTKGLR